nr:HrpE family protein [Xanthomonas dyei]
MQQINDHGRFPGAAATHVAHQQLDSLLGDLGTSDADQKRMNNRITMLKNDLDFNVSLNKFIGKAGDNAKCLVGQ